MKWSWMMNWCKQQGLAPANHNNWILAEEAYNINEYIKRIDK